MIIGRSIAALALLLVLGGCSFFDRQGAGADGQVWRWQVVNEHWLVLATDPLCETSDACISDVISFSCEPDASMHVAYYVVAATHPEASEAMDVGLELDGEDFAYEGRAEAGVLMAAVNDPDFFFTKLSMAKRLELEVGDDEVPPMQLDGVREATATFLANCNGQATS